MSDMPLQLFIPNGISVDRVRKDIVKLLIKYPYKFNDGENHFIYEISLNGVWLSIHDLTANQLFYLGAKMKFPDKYLNPER